MRSGRSPHAPLAPSFGRLPHQAVETACKAARSDALRAARTGVGMIKASEAAAARVRPTGQTAAAKDFWHHRARADPEDRGQSGQDAAALGEAAYAASPAPKKLAARTPHDCGEDRASQSSGEANSKWVDPGRRQASFRWLMMAAEEEGGSL